MVFWKRTYQSMILRKFKGFLMHKVCLLSVCMKRYWQKFFANFADTGTFLKNILLKGNIDDQHTFWGSRIQSFRHVASREKKLWYFYWFQSYWVKILVCKVLLSIFYGFRESIGGKHGISEEHISNYDTFKI